jgi:MoaA/NifB/PqqE/SkfB family radical SAM enzyme
MSLTDSKIERIKSWLSDKKAFPWHMQLQPTYRCNLECKFCWRQTYSRHEELSDKRWEEITQEACDLHPYELTIVGGGEPLVRNKLYERMAEIIKKNNIKGCTITNGTLFHKKLAEKLVKIGWDTIGISIHSSTPSIDNFLRGHPRAFQMTMRSIRNINYFKNKYSSEVPIILFHSLITRYNVNELSRMIIMGWKLGVRVIIFRMVNDNPKRPKFFIRKNQLSILEKKLEETKSLAHKLGMDLQLQFSLNDIKKAFGIIKMGEGRKGENSQSKERKKVIKIACARPFSEMVIIPDGTTSPCCLFCEGKYSSASKKTNIYEFLESAKEKSLTDIWFGEKMEKFRKLSKEGELPAYCKIGCTIDYRYLEESGEIYLY